MVIGVIGNWGHSSRTFSFFLGKRVILPQFQHFVEVGKSREFTAIMQGFKDGHKETTGFSWSVEGGIGKIKEVRKMGSEEVAIFEATQPGTGKVCASYCLDEVKDCAEVTVKCPKGMVWNPETKKCIDLGPEIEKYAEKWLGYPRAEGPDANNPENGFDCSGYTQYVYKHFGINLSHKASSQYNELPHVASPQVGDLVFFGNLIRHVGIVVGEDLMKHVSSKRKQIIRASISNFSKYSIPLMGYAGPSGWSNK